MAGITKSAIILALCGLVFGNLLPLAAQGARAAGAAGRPVVIEKIEYHIQGLLLEPALAAFLDLEVGRIFANEEAALAYAADANRRLLNNRVFALESSVRLEMAEASISAGPDAGQDASERTQEQPLGASLVVRAVTSITALALPYPKYNSSDGFSLAVRYKDYNFLGTLEPMTLNFDYFSETSKAGAGVKFTLPFDLANYSANLNFDLAISASPEGLVLEGGAGLGLSRELPGLGSGWSTGHNLSYSYDADSQLHSMAFGGSLSYDPKLTLPLVLSVASTAKLDYADAIDSWLSSSLTASSSQTLFEKSRYGSLGLSLSTGPFLDTNLPYFAYRDGGWSLNGALTGDSVAWRGNQRGGSYALLSFDSALHVAPETEAGRYSLAFTLETEEFGALNPVVGLNLRGLAKWFASWTLLGAATDFDWGDEVRGLKDTITGDLGFVVSAELPVNFAQGRFFGLDLLSAEVFTTPFVDAGIVRVDPSESFGSADQRILCGGLEVVVFPDKARAFAYRVSVGADLLGILEIGAIDSSVLEIYLGLGLHF